jgi:hypothetical protein
MSGRSSFTWSPHHTFATDTKLEHCISGLGANGKLTDEALNKSYANAKRWVFDHKNPGAFSVRAGLVPR